MAEHRIRKNNIIYIIPNDELYEKLKNNEAFIDEYGRLMNRKPHRVLKELKHYVEKQSSSPKKPPEQPPVPTRKSSPVIEHFKETTQVKVMEVGDKIINRTVDAFFDDLIPTVWHKYIVPSYYRVKEALTSKKSKPHSVIPKAKTTGSNFGISKTGTRMTQPEADVEKRKVLYHWLGMLSSLKKLHDAGEIDIELTLSQLTDPVMLERVNVLLGENPNLLEVNNYITLCKLLGRDLYQEEQLIPITAAEITTIATTYGFDVKKRDIEG